MLGSYTAITALDALDQLATRLYDPTYVHWTQVELLRYLSEALRTYNALTLSYRHTAVWTTTALQTFYDLPIHAPALRGYTVTVRDLILDLEYALQEPPSSQIWTGTNQFSLVDLVNAIQNRRDQFLLITGAVLSDVSLPQIAPPPGGRVAIPEDIVTIRRVAWKTTDNLVTPVRRDDAWGAAHYKPGWVQQPRRPPTAYSLSSTQPLYVQFVPPPLDTGTVFLLSVQRGAVLDVAANTPLGVPDDWAWVIKFGALADLLSRDGLAFDPVRASYAQQRWEQGVQAASTASVVLDARINNRVVGLASVNDADKYSPLWQSVNGTPRRLVTAGQNLVGCWPPPGANLGGGNFAITVDLVVNMPVPTGTSSYLQIGPEQLDPVLDYAQHLAILKEGPNQLVAAVPLAQRFFDQIGVKLALQQAEQPARVPLLQQTLTDVETQPRARPVVPSEVG